MKNTTAFSLGIERGASGYSAVWCFDFPGCYALVPPGADPLERAELGILEFAAWSHNRAADRLTVDREHLTLMQSLETGEAIADGDGSALFLHDAEPASPKEFPGWANFHDLAMDELRDLAGSLPGTLLDHPVALGQRTIKATLIHVAATERWHALNLTGKDGRKGDVRPEALRELQDAHRYLQEAVCDVPPAMRIQRDTSPVHGGEDWTVRKTMRRSIWHLRYHTAELRRALSGLWLA